MRVTPPLSRGVLIAASEPSVKLARIFDLLVAAFDTMLSVVLTPVAVNEELELETVPLAMIGHGRDTETTTKTSTLTMGSWLSSADSRQRRSWTRSR